MRALMGSMRPVTVKSKTETMRLAIDVPRMRYMRTKEGYLHMSGDGFTKSKHFAWFNLPSRFAALKKQKPWINDHSWIEEGQDNE